MPGVEAMDVEAVPRASILDVLVLQTGEVPTEEEEPEVPSSAQPPPIRITAASRAPIHLDLKIVAREQERDAETSSLMDWLSGIPLSKLDPFVSDLVTTIGAQLLVDEGVLYCVRSIARKKTVQAIYVPIVLREEAMRSCHDTIDAGHFGFTRSYQKLQETYFWPRMAVDVSHWCKTCLRCQSRNSPRARPNGLMGTLPLEIGIPMEQINIDHTVEFPKSKNGNKHILVVTCRLTKFVEAFPVKDLTAVTTANVLAKQVFCRYGAPSSILSDNGGAFTANLTSELFRIYGIDQKVTSPYHPQENGQTERANHTIKGYLAKFVNAQRNNWDDLLPFFCAAYNSSIHSTTLETPFFLMFGRDPRTLMDSVLNRNDPGLNIPERRESLFQDLHSAWESARDLIVEGHEVSKVIYDKKRRNVEFELGDRVWVDMRRTDSSKKAKLGLPWFGPYRIAQKCSPLTYRVEDIQGRKSELEVHVERLKPFVDRDPPKGIPVPKGRDSDQALFEWLNRDLDYDDKIYKVKTILDERKKAGSATKYEYLVEWVGYPDERTWIPEDEVIDKDLLVNFYRRRPRTVSTEVGGVRNRRSRR